MAIYKIRDIFYLFIFFRNLSFAKSVRSAEPDSISRGYVAGVECQMRVCTLKRKYFTFTSYNSEQKS